VFSIRQTSTSVSSINIFNPPNRLISTW
jgi:hypothetical protein